MKAFGRLVVACGAVALMAAPALAQQGRGGRGGFGFGGGGAALLSNKSVQKELKATDEQVEKLNAFAREMMEKQREEFQNRGDQSQLSQEERRERSQQLARTRAAELLKGMAGILKPEQIGRFEEIQLQQSGVGAFSSPRVQARLKLTEDQQDKLREINMESFRAMREAGQEDRDAARAKAAEIRKEALEKAVGVLTDDQKKAWKELTGEPFEIVFEPRGQN